MKAHIRRFAHLVLAFALALSVGQGFGARAFAGQDYKAAVRVKVQNKMAFEVLTIVNKERAAVGQPALVMSKDLLAVANLRAAETTVYWDHTRPTGESCFTAADDIGGLSAMGENIAWGQTSASQVMNSWMSSSGHKANILRNSYTEVGISCVLDSAGALNWVQFFGNRSGVAAASKSADAYKTSAITANTDYTYRMSYDENGGSSVLDGCAPKYPLRGTGAVGYLPTTTRAGYSFVGWYTAESGGTKVSTSTKVTKNVTYYAHWKAGATKAKVTYDARGGKVKGKSKYSKTYKYKAKLGKLPVAKKKGYKFKGWYTKKSGGTKVKASTKAPAKNTTYYARWKR